MATEARKGSADAPAKKAEGQQSGGEPMVKHISLADEFRKQGDLCFESTLTIIVVGASGDLAKKKTFPAIMDLYQHNFLPEHVVIFGYARSSMTDDDLRGRLKPFLMKAGEGSSESDEKTKQVDAFLQKVFYVSGDYYSQEHMKTLAEHIDEKENVLCKREESDSSQPTTERNRMWYFAIPPNVFLVTAATIKAVGVDNNGWTRLIVEKPFGHDYKSALDLVKKLNEQFDESHIYRIDHYLGKEMVQNLVTLRFSNIMFEPLWNQKYVKCVQFTFKENFGTEGRGGYFDNYGIIRDVIQNHLVQVFTLMAMEGPIKVSGPAAANFMRNEKVKVLQAIPPIKLQDVVLGQYVANDGKPGYLDDEGVPNDSKTPTFATVVLYVNNGRWEGVPFIFRAGKALNERKAEVRIQFKEAPGSNLMFGGNRCPRNELVLRLQPDESVYLKTNVKAPGLRNKPMQSELDLSYDMRFPTVYNPDAYTRLLLDVLGGHQGTFVRSDELLESWKIFTPLLEKIAAGEVPLVSYKYGSRGPSESDELIRKKGYVYNEDYKWGPPSHI